MRPLKTERFPESASGNVKLQRHAAPDIRVCVLTSQEVQSLSGKNALLTEKDKGKVWALAVQKSLEGYKLVAARQMVGVYLIVMAVPKVASNISNVRIGEIGTGFMNHGGNKGAVAARFEIMGIPICCISR